MNLFSVPPHLPFLKTLVEAIRDGRIVPDWPRTGPFWLSDMTIVLPTRRAKLALANMFLAAGETLLPDIRTFGGEAGDEEPFLPPFEAPAPRPAMPPIERKLVLARLIAAWAETPEARDAFSSPPHAGEILALAKSLAELIDDLTVAGVAPKALETLNQERDLAANWQRSLRFLSIALSAWPAILEAGGRADAAALRNERLLRQAQAAPLLYGERPVIAAGSTGSVPATAELLAALARLPRGALVLPGYDTTLAEPELTALLDPKTLAHGHPQYGLVHLLRRLNGLGRVTELGSGPAPRSTILRRALALAEGTAHWQKDRAAMPPEAMAAGLAGIATIAAQNEGEEARAVALLARDGLARGRSVGIVTPDRNLARRIAAELLRFGILVDDSAGAPLFQSPAGRLARLTLALCRADFAPVDLMALLRNRSARLGLSRVRVAHLADRLELGLLRGQRLAPGLAGLRRALAANLAGADPLVAQRLDAEDAAGIGDLLDRLETRMAPLCALLAQPHFSAAAFAAALAACVAAVGEGAEGDAADAMPGLAEFTRWAEDLAARQGEGPPLAAGAVDSVLYGLMAGVSVRNPQPRRDDIAIWGRIEARLQNPDLLILAGLNEDIWPEPADPGPWLNRAMRLAVGLEPPERRQGLAAHDFEMGMGNAEVAMAFAERLGGSPALPSRLVQRLEAFIGRDWAAALRQRGAAWLAQARRLDAAGEPWPALRRLPRPAAALRPRRLSVTEIETLLRSPYDLYARHVLRLRPLDPLGEEPGARDRGSMIHAVFARFVREERDILAPDAERDLQAMALEAFAGMEGLADRRDIWLRRFARAAQAFLAFERERASKVGRRHAEVSGQWPFPALQDFRLNGRADRLDLMADGSFALIDFKTGSVPKPEVMRGFEAPQLLLEAAMARAGAFQQIAPGPVGALTYIKIGLGPEAFLVTQFALPRDMGLDEAIDEIGRRVQGHVQALLLDDKLPMAAHVLPLAGQRFAGAYDHLARTAEWTLAEGEDEP